MTNALLLALILAAGEPVLPTLLQPSPALTPPGFEEVAAEVALTLTLSETGEVVEVSPGPEPGEVPAPFVTAAVSAARGLRFTPAQVDGVPTAAQVPFLYRFEPRAPTAVLRGQIRARGSRHGLPGAALSVNGQSYEAGPDGSFALTLPPGGVRIRVSAQGHHPAEFTEVLEKDQLAEVVYRLEAFQLDPYQTVVRERARVEVTRIALAEQEVREVPGTMGDPARVVMLLPGVASVASGLGFPVVRGTQPASTQYFIDGVRVPTLYHLMVGPAVLHPAFVDGVDFEPGVPGAHVGRALGGVVHLRAGAPLEAPVHMEAYADLINLGGLVQASIPQTGTKLSLAGRFSYTGALAELVARALREDGLLQTDFSDMQVRVDQRLGDGQLRLLWLASTDRVGVDTREDRPSNMGGGVATGFHRLDLRWTHPLARGVLELAGTWSGDAVELYATRAAQRIGAFDLRSMGLGARARYTVPLGEQLRLEVGAESEQLRGGVSLTGTARPPGFAGDDVVDPVRAPSAIAVVSGAWTSATWTPLPSLEVTAGVRGDVWHLVPGRTQAVAEPRAAVRWQLTDHLTWKAGAGLFHQAPTVLLPLPATDLGALRLGLQEGAQLVTGVEWAPSRALQVGVDAFYNPLRRAIELDLDDLIENRRRQGLPPLDPSTRGYSAGAELFVRKPIGDNWFGWLSYSFVRSRRLTQIDRYDDFDRELGQAWAWLPFAFEQEHVFNGALSVQLGPWTLGAVAHFNTGRPRSGQVTSRDRRRVTDAERNPRWVRVDLDRVGRLPPFWRVDLRAARRWAVGDITLEGYLDLLNASLQQETVGYEYGEHEVAVRIPVIFPTLGLKGSW